MRKLKVSCLKCKQFDVLTIDEERHVVMLTEMLMNCPFRSFRWRGDENWGFLCSCGNDSRLSREEKPHFKNLVAGTTDGIAKVAESLKIRDELKFRIEAA